MTLWWSYTNILLIFTLLPVTEIMHNRVRVVEKREWWEWKIAKVWVLRFNCRLDLDFDDVRLNKNNDKWLWRLTWYPPKISKSVKWQGFFLPFLTHVVGCWCQTYSPIPSMGWICEMQKDTEDTNPSFSHMGDLSCVHTAGLNARIRRFAQTWFFFS